jgi:hypothetical protein
VRPLEDKLTEVEEYVISALLGSVFYTWDNRDWNMSWHMGGEYCLNLE